MRRAVAVLGVLGSLMFAGCGESYSPIPGTDPQQVLVRDGGDKVDQANIKDACVGLGAIERFVYVQERKNVIVTCTGDGD